MQQTAERNKSKVFAPGEIDSLTLRNRTIRSACFEGMCQHATPSETLIEHHRKIAAGGVGMTTVAYCAVSKDGAAFAHEMWMREEIVPILKKLTDAVHKEGAAASIQLAHCGFFASKAATGITPIGPSRKFCSYRYSFCRPMTTEDLNRVKEDFGKAALMAKKAGFDAVEIHAGHGYLLSQFLSPWTNSRTDEYGGPLENRVRYPASVIKQVRSVVGPDFPILVKMNLEDGFKGGLTVDESVEVAKRFEAEGASALVPSCGFTARTSLYMMRGHTPLTELVRSEKNPVAKMATFMFGRFLVKDYEFKEMFLFEQAKTIRAAVKIPVVYIGGILSVDNMNKAMNEGFEFVQIGRATVRDPNIINKMMSGEVTASDCDHCNRCIGEMAATGVFCTSEKKGLLKDS